MLAVCRSSLAACAVDASVTPPTTRGVRSGAWSATPGSMRSGLKATNTSVPTLNPLARGGSTISSRVHPTYVVDVSTMTWPSTAWRTTFAHAADSARKSGDWCASWGWEKRTTTASASRTALGSVVNLSESKFSCTRSRSRSSRSTLPFLILVSRSSLTSQPMICAPFSASANAVGNPTYPRPTTAMFRPSSSLTSFPFLRALNTL